MITIKKLSDCTFSEANRIWNDAFSNYSVNFQVTVDQLSMMIGKRELRPSSSIVAFQNGKPVGFVFNAIKTINGVKTAWNGGTGVSPSSQGHGIGRILMDATIDLYKKERVEVATLEVITSNVPGVKLYESVATKLTRLFPLLQGRITH